MYKLKSMPKTMIKYDDDYNDSSKLRKMIQNKNIMKTKMAEWRKEVESVEEPKEVNEEIQEIDDADDGEEM